MNEKTWKLDKVVYSFTQEGNCNGTTQDYEELEITNESTVNCLTEDEGFYVIKTNGWSIDNENELVDIFKTIKRGVITKAKE